MIQKKNPYILQKGIVIQKNEGEISIFDPDNSYLFTMNETAAFIFERIKKGMSGNEICKQLTTIYDITSAVAEKDVNTLIEKLKKYKILLNE
jgi:hypothetical protein